MPDVSNGTPVLCLNRRSSSDHGRSAARMDICTSRLCGRCIFKGASMHKRKGFKGRVELLGYAGFLWVAARNTTWLTKGGRNALLHAQVEDGGAHVQALAESSLAALQGPQDAGGCIQSRRQTGRGAWPGANFSKAWRRVSADLGVGQNSDRPCGKRGWKLWRATS
jgi:hypothetical protein